MQPGIKHFDMVMGLDIHLTVIGPSTIPLPYPFLMGMVMDVMDYIPILGATVFVNGMPRGNAGTGGYGIHIPMGAMVRQLPPYEAQLYLGSQTVLADSEPFTYGMLQTLTCNDFGIPAPMRVKKGASSGFYLPTSVVIPIPAPMPVIVGGPPVPSFTAIAMSWAMTGLGKGLGKLAKKAAKTKIGKAVVGSTNAAFGKLKNSKLGQQIQAIKCTFGSDPVDVISGNMVMGGIDFELPGPIPFAWTRTWYSSSDYSGPLGNGWHHAFDMALVVDEIERVVAVRHADGRPLAFPTLNVGEQHYLRGEKVWLRRDERGYCFINEELLEHRFEEAGGQFQGVCPLKTIESRAGHQIQFFYDEQSYLIKVIDSSGRSLKIENDSKGRIEYVLAPDPDNPDSTFPIVSYDYDANGNLIAVKDAEGNPFQMKHDSNHLITQWKDRNGASFHYRYRRFGIEHRCVEAWGDDDLMHYKFDYHDQIKKTTVTNSLGTKTVYYGNDLGMVIREERKDEIIERLINEHGEILTEVNPLGETQSFAFDDQGNTVLETNAAGDSVSMQYNEWNQLVQLVDPNGGKYLFEYDEQAQLISRTDPLGHTTHYGYREGLLTELTDPLGQSSHLAYNEEGLLYRAIMPDTFASYWDYDTLGRLTETIDPAGNSRKLSYDKLGNPIRIAEPDGNIQHLRYDGEGNAIYVRDRHRTVRFSYQWMGLLKSRQENGTTVRFEYDTEEQLTKVINEQGHAYTFSYDHNGKVIKETSFAGIWKSYRRDRAGKVIRMERPSGLNANYVYDAAERLIGVSYANGETESYGYRADGALVEATNGDAKIGWELDPLGRVLKEVQGDYAVHSSYDAQGRRTQLRSSMGAEVEFSHDAMGEVNQILAKQGSTQWQANFQRDKLGLETERTISGGVKSRWRRHRYGLPLQHKIESNVAVEERRREYKWEADSRLSWVADSMFDTVHFEHDAVGNLAVANYSDGRKETRQPDSVGNLFPSGDPADYEYGQDGQIQRSAKATYRYDKDGNRIEKRLKNGKKWQYAWNAAGMLSQVIRPDGKEVRFAYDALGRRISKTFGTRTTHWLWDGDVPIHEWKTFERGNEITSSSPTTWVFEPNTFAPMAKLEAQQGFGILTDHLGTPVAMHNDGGRLVWSGELSVFKGISVKAGEALELPFRFPGQYEDEETGLYYNRFRYYDPEEGGYVSEDPIGLVGGTQFYSYVKDVNVWIDQLGLHGNCKGSKKPNHVYVIINKKTWQVHKYGISGGRIRRDGKSSRAESQIRKLGPDYKSKIITRDVSRRKALDIEQGKVNAYSINKQRQGVAIDDSAPLGNRLPKPKIEL